MYSHKNQKLFRTNSQIDAKLNRMFTEKRRAQYGLKSIDEELEEP
jgi:hypothetical protein